jgi:hypothetical protein
LVDVGSKLEFEEYVLEKGVLETLDKDGEEGCSPVGRFVSDSDVVEAIDNVEDDIEVEKEKLVAANVLDTVEEV